MLFQHVDINRIEDPLGPMGIAACSDIEVPAAPVSRRTPWLNTRFGFVGSSEGFDLLRFEAPTLALSPATAPGLISAGLIDALVVESAPDDLSGEWGLSFLDWGSADDQARTLMDQVAKAGIPRIALLRGGTGQTELFGQLAAEADHVVVTDPAVQAALRDRGVSAELTLPVMQPALTHGFAARDDAEQQRPTLLSLDLARAVDDPETATVLESLIPFGLGLCSADQIIRRYRVDTMSEALIDACIGTVTRSQLRHLLAGADLLVQIAWPGREPGPDIQHALDAAASRTVVVILGEVPADDPRRAFAHVFADPRDLRIFLSRFTMDPLAAHTHARAIWRKVHGNHGAEGLALQIARCVHSDAAPRPRPMATVITPTCRPERLEQVLETFRAQSWPERELVVVANTDRPGDWNADLLRAQDGERIVYLPRRFGPGTALNLGATRGSGDYVLRMDDDDRYGIHYVEDLMLGAAALRPDMMGLTATFYLYLGDDRLVWWPDVLKSPSLYACTQIPRGGHIAGFSHTVRRSLLREIPYPDRQHGGVDTGFLDALSSRNDLTCARLDGLNAVVERRADARSHTWQAAPAADSPRYRTVDVPLADLLNTDLLAGSLPE